MVCHFYRSNNLPCQVIDRHLAELAVKHMETKFVRVHAEKAPFLTGEAEAAEGRTYSAATFRTSPLTLLPHLFALTLTSMATCAAERLKIWMLPTLAIIRNEKTTDYVVGLDDLGGSADFPQGGWVGVGGRVGGVEWRLTMAVGKTLSPPFTVRPT